MSLEDWAGIALLAFMPAVLFLVGAGMPVAAFVFAAFCAGLVVGFCLVAGRRS
jgi:hypothetical protein